MNKRFEIPNDIVSYFFKSIIEKGKYRVEILDDRVLIRPREEQEYYKPVIIVKDLEELNDALVNYINTLNDSLHKLIVPEIIDDFKCSNCNKNVRISKITSLNKLPNVLIIHLKRFYLDYEKDKMLSGDSKVECVVWRKVALSHKTLF